MSLAGITSLTQANCLSWSHINLCLTQSASLNYYSFADFACDLRTCSAPLVFEFVRDIMAPNKSNGTKTLPAVNAADMEALRKLLTTAMAKKNGDKKPAAKAEKKKKKKGKKEEANGKPAVPKITASAPGPSKGVQALSPYSSTLIPVLTLCGAAFPYTGIVRADITLNTGDTVIIGATNTGQSGTVFTVGYLAAGALTVPSYAVYTIAAIAASDVAGGPTSGRAMKCSLGLVCTTPQLSRGGRVTTLNSQSRVRLDFAPSLNNRAQFLALADSIRIVPTSKALDATDFAPEKQMSNNIVDQTTYEDFEEWAGTQSVDEFWEHIAVWPGATRRDRPMSTAWCVLSPPVGQQTYTISGSASYYTRWPLFTVPGQSMRPIPTASASTINNILYMGEVAAENFQTIATGMRLAGRILSL